MRRQQNRWLLTALLGLLLSACAGGSGSSGFDARFAESAAISEAVMTGHCVPVKDTELTICPADVNMPAGAPGSIETGLDQSNKVPCAQGAADVCAFSLPLMPDGLPTGAVLRVATRHINPLGAWSINAVAAGMPAPGANQDVEVPVIVGQATDGPASANKIQVAVLVFLSPPTTLPSTVQILAETGADFAFVLGTVDLMVTP